MNKRTNNLLRKLEQAFAHGEIDNYDLHQLLATRRQIAVFWHAEDVLAERPDLNEEQAWEVLQEVGCQHDACFGINWETIDFHAAMMFPEPEPTPEATIQPTTI